ncbi:MAG: hypothetical protein FJ387_25090 [Verrucomicrobia bacterium]|nr:hypothetical protein [Verrucomicrobiota bacterium]
MPGRKALTVLEAQKQTLRVTSDLNRLALQLELRHVSATAQRLKAVGDGLRALPPWLVVTLPVAGVVLACGWRGRPIAALPGCVAAAGKWLRPLLAWFGTRASAPAPRD